MDFFGMGSGEIILVAIVALIIWGPAKLPEIARNLGRFVRGLRQTSSELTSQIKRELEAEEIKERTHLPPPTVAASPQPPNPSPEATTQTSGED